MAQKVWVWRGIFYVQGKGCVQNILILKKHYQNQKTFFFQSYKMVMVWE